MMLFFGSVPDNTNNNNPFASYQATTPSYEYSDAVLLAILEVLTWEYPKPLPPLDVCFLHEVFHRGARWASGCLRLAARQAAHSGSARRLVDNYLQALLPDTSQVRVPYFIRNVGCHCGS
jgi:hypothetical protein